MCILLIVPMWNQDYLNIYVSDTEYSAWIGD